MADFCQNPDLVTIHNLRRMTDAEMELKATCQLHRFSRREGGSVAVAVPLHLRDFGQPSMRRILHLLQQGQLVNRVILVLNGASADDCARVLSGFAVDADRFRILWAESPEIVELDRLMKARLGMGTGAGKGTACWLAAGYATLDREIAVLAFHDADVENYTTAMTARLVEPLLNRDNSMDIAKAFYARVGDRMYGRVTRQFLTPFVDAALKLFPQSAYMRLLRSLRYPLSGEVALSSDMLRQMPFYTGWSLELGMLWSIHRHQWTSRFCQVEIADDYRHRHHPVSCDDSRKQSLEKMATALANTLFRILEQEGNPVTTWHRNAFLRHFERSGFDYLCAYRIDATHNDLEWDENREYSAQTAFLNRVKAAMTTTGDAFTSDILLPPWERVLAEVPEAESLLRRATRQLAGVTALPYSSMGCESVELPTMGVLREVPACINC